MGYYPTKEGTKFFKNLIKHEEGPWYLILLPTSQWAAFWSQGMDTCYSESIFDGVYDRSCAFIGNKKETIEYILKSLEKDNLDNPLNFNYDTNKIRKNLLRVNSKLNKYPD